MRVDGELLWSRSSACRYAILLLRLRDMCARHQPLSPEPVGVWEWTRRQGLLGWLQVGSLNVDDPSGATACVDLQT